MFNVFQIVFQIYTAPVYTIIPAGFLLGYFLPKKIIWVPVVLVLGFPAYIWATETMEGLAVLVLMSMFWAAGVFIFSIGVGFFSRRIKVSIHRKVKPIE